MLILYKSGEDLNANSRTINGRILLLTKGTFFLRVRNICEINHMKQIFCSKTTGLDHDATMKL